MRASTVPQASFRPGTVGGQTFFEFSPVTSSAPARIFSEASLTVWNLPPKNNPERPPKHLWPGRIKPRRAPNHRGGIDRGPRQAGQYAPKGTATKAARAHSRFRLPVRLSLPILRGSHRNRHEPQIAAHLHGRNRSRSEIVKRQNSYGRIAEEGLGEAHFERGSEVADAESPGNVVEAMDRQLATGRAEPKRIPGLRVNSQPAGSGSDTT